jgi:hypothetical protein
MTSIASRVACLLLLLLAACSAEDEPLTLGRYQQRFTETWCERFIACGAPGTVEQCLLASWAAPTGPHTDLFGARLVASGRIRFDPVRGEACLAEMRDATCIVVIGIEPAYTMSADCQLAISGDQVAGEVCQSDFDQCQHGLFCDYPSDCVDQCCEGTCVGVPGLFKTEGLPCSDLDYECDWPLTCNQGICGLGSAAGDACSDGCAGENICVDGTCVAYFPTSDGSPCAADNSTGFCDEDSFCSTVGTCYHFQKAHQACGPEAGHCAPYFRCVAGLCVDQALDGEACTADLDCLTGGYCVEGTCIPLGSDGSPCAADDACASGACEAGVCTSVPRCAR